MKEGSGGLVNVFKDVIMSEMGEGREEAYLRLVKEMENANTPPQSFARKLLDSVKLNLKKVEKTDDRKEVLEVLVRTVATLKHISGRRQSGVIKDLYDASIGVLKSVNNPSREEIVSFLKGLELITEVIAAYSKDRG